MVAGIARFFGAAIVLLAGFSPLHAQQPAPEPAQQPVPKPAQIDRNGVLILVRSTLGALDQANKTGNYTVFRDLAAPDFSAINNAARLGDIFAVERRNHLDLSGALVLDPQLTVLPEIDQAGRMRFAGFFPSVPTQVTFRLVFAPVNGQWRLDEIGVNLAPSSPVAPIPPPPPPPVTVPPVAKVVPKPVTHPPKKHRPTAPNTDAPAQDPSSQ